jgi:DNA-binding HxlR family transcriptional regulator
MSAPHPRRTRSTPAFSARTVQAARFSTMVMAVLAEPCRFNEIKRRLEGVTQRVLT